MAAFLPVLLNITDKLILIVGGGRVACNKVRVLEVFTHNIKVVAPKIEDSLKNKGYELIEKPYHKSDLKGVSIVYACTGLPELNRLVKIDAKRLGIMCNVVDNPQLCDFVSPAIYKNGAYTVACGSDGLDVHKSIEIRDKIKEYFENNRDVFHNAKYL